jgi:hypothetical protein
MNWLMVFRLAFAFLAYVTTCGCSDRFDSRSESSREANAVRSLLHGQDSLDWIYSTLSVRGYTCSDQRDLNRTRMVACEKASSRIYLARS